MHSVSLDDENRSSLWLSLGRSCQASISVHLFKDEARFDDLYHRNLHSSSCLHTEGSVDLNKRLNLFLFPLLRRRSHTCHFWSRANLYLAVVGNSLRLDRRLPSTQSLIAAWEWSTWDHPRVSQVGFPQIPAKGGPDSRATCSYEYRLHL